MRSERYSILLQYYSNSTMGLSATVDVVTVCVESADAVASSAGAAPFQPHAACQWSLVKREGGRVVMSKMQQ